jgi:hypothetical protein
MHKYKEAFENNLLDLQLLCQALGSQDLDKDFMQ